MSVYDNKDLDETLDLLIKNADVLKQIKDDERFAYERQTLENIQESILNELCSEKESSTLIENKLHQQNKPSQLKKELKESVFRKRPIIRKSRKKQVL